jgi:hypothetical protein
MEQRSPQLTNGSFGQPSRSAPRRRTSPLLRFLAWTLVGGALGVLATLAVLRILYRDTTPQLTPELYEAAREQWRKTAPPDYDIEIHVSGNQPAIYRVQVRGGQAQAAWRNGQPLTTRRTFGTWSVPGMFSTMSRDVEQLERQLAGKADPRLPSLILRAGFDDRYGYPARYSRIEWGSRKGTTATAVTWDVTEFEVLPSR